MKQIHVITAVLCALLSLEAHAQTPIQNFTDLDQALQNPSVVKTLKLEAGAPRLNEFITQAGQFNSLEEVCILGFNNAEELEAVIDELTLVPTLRKVIAPLKDIEDLPANIHRLDQLSSLEIIPASNLASGNYKRLKSKAIVVDFVTADASDKILSITYFSTRPKLDDRGVVRLVEVFPNAVVDAAMESENLGMFRSNKSATYDGVAFTKMYKHIKPPIKGVDVERNSYRLATNKNHTVYYKSGTQIFIPESAFVDRNGNVVKGDIDFHYREFRDPVEMLVSGIPMTYDSGEVRNDFESAGMFEMLASKNGQEVFMNKNTSVKLDFAATDARTSFNFYNFDDASGKWKFRGKAGSRSQIKVKTRRTKTGALVAIAPPANLTVPLSAAWRKYKKKAHLAAIQPVDSTLYIDRFADTTYFHRADQTGKKNSLVHKRLKDYQEADPDTKAARKLHREMRKVNPIEIERYQGERKRREYWFTMEFKNKNFPELLPTKNMVWVYDGDLPYKAIRKEYFYRQCIIDMKVEYIDAEDTYKLTFKTPDGFKEMKAYPRYRNVERGEDKARADYAQLNERIAKKQFAAGRGVNRKLENRQQRVDRAVEFNKTFSQTSWKAARPFMAMKEREMSHSEWMAYYNKLMVSMDRSGALAAIDVPIVRALAIDGFGVWNCDQIERIEEGVQVLASYENMESEKLEPAITFVIDSKLNGVLRYDGYLGLSPEKFAISSSTPSTILTISDDGNLAYMTRDDVGELRLRDNAKLKLKMTEVDYGISSVEDLRSILGI